MWSETLQFWKSAMWNVKFFVKWEFHFSKNVPQVGPRFREPEAVLTQPRAHPIAHLCKVTMREFPSRLTNPNHAKSTTRRRARWVLRCTTTTTVTTMRRCSRNTPRTTTSTRWSSSTLSTDPSTRNERTGAFFAKEAYRGANKGLHVLLSRTQAGPGRTVKQEEEEISRNHVQTFIFLSV